MIEGWENCASSVVTLIIMLSCKCHVMADPDFITSFEGEVNDSFICVLPK